MHQLEFDFAPDQGHLLTLSRWESIPYLARMWKCTIAKAVEHCVKCDAHIRFKRAKRITLATARIISKKGIRYSL